MSDLAAMRSDGYRAGRDSWSDFIEVPDAALRKLSTPKKLRAYVMQLVDSDDGVEALTSHVLNVWGDHFTDEDRAKNNKADMLASYRDGVIEGLTRALERQHGELLRREG